MITLLATRISHILIKIESFWGDSVQVSSVQTSKFSFWQHFSNIRFIGAYLHFVNKFLAEMKGN